MTSSKPPSNPPDMQQTMEITSALDRIGQKALFRSATLIDKERRRRLELPSRFLLQMAHLTTPATVWKYVEGAVTRSRANLVMLDLEDSIPRDNAELLEQGRSNVIRAFNELDWGTRLRFFRPRGLHLDPAHEDIIAIVSAAGARIDGLCYPKVESAEDVRSIDDTLAALEERQGLARGAISVQVLIESVLAEEKVFEIAQASRRLSALIFGAFDYWGSLGIVGVPYRHDHPLVDQARARIVKAAASVGIPAIAEMTLNFPTKDKPPASAQAALDECRRDALRARDFGFAGKWTGIPAQTEIALEVFTLSDAVIENALAEARLFLAAEREGKGATMIKGKMADRATDRVNRVALRTALALGKLSVADAADLGIG